jgi:hypothetical protein
MIVDVIIEIDIVAYGQFECHMQLPTLPSKSANGADNGLLQALQRKNIYIYIYIYGRPPQISTRGIRE